MFNNYPRSSLTSTERYLTTKTAEVNGKQITGYCFDEDNDVVWLEGTGQMALAFGIANMNDQKAKYLNEMEKVLIKSTAHSNSIGFPYASNLATSYGSGKLWKYSSTKISISGGAWYLFAKNNFNPFNVGRNKEIPASDVFWLN